MKVAITGASGMIGLRLAERLLEEGHNLLLFSRNPKFESSITRHSEVRIFKVDLEQKFSTGYLEGIDVLVNLAGARIKASRWSQAHKEEIRNSRINITRNLVRAVVNCKKPPSVFISASATGYYGNRGDTILTEDSGNGQGFLAGVTGEWEDEAKKAEGPHTRVVLLRSAPVLDPEDGALPEIIRSFRLGFSSVLGTGTQWMSWIHRDDEVNLIIWAMENPLIRGSLNASAPGPAMNADFMKAVAEQLNRRLVLSVPSSVLRLTFGEMASEMLLSSQRVVPEKALTEGFEFEFPVLETALSDLLGKSARR